MLDYLREDAHVEIAIRDRNVRQDADLEAAFHARARCLDAGASRCADGSTTNPTRNNPTVSTASETMLQRNHGLLHA
jgi:hypothetical protein